MSNWRFLACVLAIAGCAVHRAEGTREFVTVGDHEEVNWAFIVSDAFVEDVVGKKGAALCRDRLSADATSCSFYIETCSNLVVFRDHAEYHVDAAWCSVRALPEPVRPAREWHFVCGTQPCGTAELPSARFIDGRSEPE